MMSSSQYTDVNECPSGICGTDSVCQNYHGGFGCDCKVPGYFKVNANEKCKGKLTVSRFEHLEINDQFFQVRHSQYVFNLLHPQPSLFLFGL